MKFTWEGMWVQVEFTTTTEVSILRRILTFTSHTSRGRDGEESTVCLLLPIPGGTELEARFLSGLIDHVRQCFQEFDVTDVEEFGFPSTVAPEFTEVPENILPGIKLRAYQRHAVEKCLRWRRGVIEIPPAGGKTEICIAFVKYLLEHLPQGRILFLEPGIGLVQQTARRFQKYGMNNSLVGQLGGGVREIDRRVVIGTVDSFYNLLNSEAAQEFFSGVVAVVVDETHHASSMTNAAVITACTAAQYWIGVSGTPFRGIVPNYSNAADAIVLGLFQRLLMKISVPYLVQNGFISEPHVFLLEYSDVVPRPRKFIDKYPVVYSMYIHRNSARNSLALKVAEDFSRRDMSCLILVRLIDHGKLLLKELSRTLPVVFFASGANSSVRKAGGPPPRRILAVPSPQVESWLQERGIQYSRVEEQIKTSSKSRKKEYEEWIVVDNGSFDLKSSLNTREFSVLIGSSIFEEGEDIPDLDSVVLMAGGWSFLH